MSKCKVMLQILNRTPELRMQALIVDQDGVAQKLTGEASSLYNLQLPMTMETGINLTQVVSNRRQSEFEFTANGIYIPS